MNPVVALLIAATTVTSADGWTRESQARDGARARDGAECAMLLKWAIGRALTGETR
jgi:hypothetical protein